MTECALRADRAAAAADTDRPRIAVVGERMELATARATDHGDELSLVEARDLADGPDAAVMQLLRRDRSADASGLSLPFARTASRAPAGGGVLG